MSETLSNTQMMDHLQDELDGVLLYRALAQAEDLQISNHIGQLIGRLQPLGRESALDVGFR